MIDLDLGSGLHRDLCTRARCRKGVQDKNKTRTRFVCSR